MSKEIQKQKREGEWYYKCPVCGAVGNWKEFIESERCHTQLEQELTTLQDQLGQL